MTRFRHVCSPAALIDILKFKRFMPAYPSPLAGDSGINGYIEGLPFNYNQEIQGRGAELIIEWYEDYTEVGNQNVKYPLIPNKLIRQGAWRAVIPAKTECKYIKAVDFEITEEGKSTMSIWQTIHLKYLKYKIMKNPFFISLQY
ncbi:hypothetical protein [Shewanella glacialipiscicola]|uniref:hypothetical protein n=1 Tax=Shewanella glacialipiscicola TaxID=614069 RepID=UPI003D7B9AA7